MGGDHLGSDEALGVLPPWWRPVNGVPDLQPRWMLRLQALEHVAHLATWYTWARVGRMGVQEEAARCDATEHAAARHHPTASASEVLRGRHGWHNYQDVILRLVSVKKGDGRLVFRILENGCHDLCRKANRAQLALSKALAQIADTALRAESSAAITRHACPRVPVAWV